ncbi:kinesin-like protein KIF3C isoform X2 [Hippoglossus hippoglossus]|uniref:kinesin-like protein KIF3C isoform X2 n=1 Tax=Hippoglossus hippoglossus TaxID=8267 RepID=UPI00148D0159|nr:kinesin-like protein KIF3C isoform X2 [Hippoglossus hippoglossus]XP_035000543.1 kinesin-like protein KIF3C isoform X2 [Hippoglossus stenolepis]
MSKIKSSESVKVVVRCRPLNRKEESHGPAGGIVRMDLGLGQVILRNPRAPVSEPQKTFTFDGVYDASSKQRDLYDESVRPLIDSVLEGFNGTIFAYGQTGTGKTYTMQGAWMDPEKRGVIPNAFDHIFTHISRSQSDRQYLVRASYLEIYLEEVRDLLDPNHATARALELRESPETGVYVRDLTSCVCKSIKEIEEVMNVGNQARAVAATDMNEHSSRSHALFLITVECSQPGPDGRKHIRVGRLNLVDLAGSERQAKTGVQGERLKEAAKINLSLSALGNVISALADGRSGHVPYRDSKLTRLLQDSLGGNAKTVMVATLGPAPQHYDETLTTLRYANRAKNIQNQPRVNEDPKDALLREFQTEIARLRAQLNHRKWSSKQKKEQVEGESWERDEDEETEGEDEELEVEKDAEDYVKLQEQRLEREKEAIRDDRFMLAEEKQKLLGEKERMMGDLRKEQEATEQLTAKYKAMESKLLVGGKNIMDHTNEQQKMLEMKQQEIADQTRTEREMQQQMFVQDEETVELRETFTSLQQEVEAKTKKLKKLYAKLQCIKAEIQDVNDEHVRSRQELEQTQNELTRELKFKYLIIENFIPPEEKNKIMNRLTFDTEEDQWKFQPLVPAESKSSQMKKRPSSAVGYKRPISQYARVAIAMGAHSRYRAENIMFLELDMTPPNTASLERSTEPNQSTSGDNSPTKERGGVRKSRSWCQTPKSITSSSSNVSLAACHAATPTAAQ